MAVPSSTSAEIQPKEKTAIKGDSNESKKQEKSGSGTDPKQEKASKKSSEAKISGKLDQKDRKPENVEKKQGEAKTEVTQEELLAKDEKNKKKGAKSGRKTPNLDDSSSLLYKGSPVGSERAAETQNTLALLAAAEQMATTDKGDYDNFGPPVKPTKKP